MRDFDLFPEPPWLPMWGAPTHFCTAIEVASDPSVVLLFSTFEVDDGLSSLVVRANDRQLRFSTGQFVLVCKAASSSC